jgi:Tol biopolymer transport system component
MGTVYLARDSRLDRRVALKFLDPDRFPSDDHDVHRRLLHEARAASGLNHPNICQVYDVGGEGRDSWIAMEYVEGESLASIVRGRGRLTSAETVRIGRQLAEALAHAHERGILHRDLKSANIVCDRQGHAKILDFGIARRLAQDIAREATRTEAADTAPGVEGTLSYMAPEVIRGHAQDERSDLWALGVVLFEMLTGTLPFVGRNSFDLAASIVQGSPVQLPDTVSPSLAHVVTRLLSREPTARYASAAETAAALDALSEHRATTLHRRRVSGSRYAIAGLTVVAIVASIAWWLRRDAPLRLGEQRLISASAAPHRAPSYSPDGLTVAYVAPDAAGVQQIWAQTLAAGTAVQITTGKSNASRPRWLATNHILFALAGQGLWTVPAIGGTPTRLIERGTNPNVSRDGRRIVFEDQRVIWTAAPDGSDVHQVQGVKPPIYNLPMMPALSPDGSTIAYFSAALGPNGDFWTIPAAGGTPKRLTSDLREGGWPLWTSDGHAIIVSSARAGSRTLWQIPVDGGEPAPLTTGAGEDDQPDLTTDGGQLGYTNVRSSWELRVRDLATGTERSVLQRGLEILFPMFSPDGKRIVYFGRSDYAVAIFTINVDGSDPRQLTAGRELNHQPRWGHDGEHVYFFQHHPTVSFRRVPALGGPSIEFRPWNWETAYAPYFDPTGRFLAYLRQRPPGAPQSVSEHTVIHDVTTGQERVWAEPHTHPSAWSPDGVSLVGTQHAPGGGTLVVICRVADESCHEITRGTTPKWSPQGDRLYFVRPAAAGGSQVLWTIAVDGTDERQIGELGSFRPIDVFFDLSRTGLVAWAPLRAGQPQLWTAAIE